MESDVRSFRNASDSFFKHQTVQQRIQQEHKKKRQQKGKLMRTTDPELVSTLLPGQVKGSFPEQMAAPSETRNFIDTDIRTREQNIVDVDGGDS